MEQEFEYEGIRSLNEKKSINSVRRNIDNGGSLFLSVDRAVEEKKERSPPERLGIVDAEKPSVYERVLREEEEKLEEIRARKNRGKKRLNKSNDDPTRDEKEDLLMAKMSKPKKRRRSFLAMNPQEIVATAKERHAIQKEKFRQEKEREEEKFLPSMEKPKSANFLPFYTASPQKLKKETKSSPVLYRYGSREDGRVNSWDERRSPKKDPKKFLRSGSGVIRHLTKSAEFSQSQEDLMEAKRRRSVGRPKLKLTNLQNVMKNRKQKTLLSPKTEALMLKKNIFELGLEEVERLKLLGNQKKKKKRKRRRKKRRIVRRKRSNKKRELMMSDYDFGRKRIEKFDIHQIRNEEVDEDEQNVPTENKSEEEKEIKMEMFGVSWSRTKLAMVFVIFGLIALYKLINILTFSQED